jgi:hypothetical protein
MGFCNVTVARRRERLDLIDAGRRSHKQVGGLDVDPRQ